MLALLPINFTEIRLQFVIFYLIVLRLNYFLLINHCVPFNSNLQPYPLFNFLNFICWIFYGFFFSYIRPPSVIIPCVFYGHTQHEALLTCLWSAQFIPQSNFLKTRWSLDILGEDLYRRGFSLSGNTIASVYIAAALAGSDITRFFFFVDLYCTLMTTFCNHVEKIAKILTFLIRQ